MIIVESQLAAASISATLDLTAVPCRLRDSSTSKLGSKVVLVREAETFTTVRTVSSRGEAGWSAALTVPSIALVAPVLTHEPSALHRSARCTPINV